MRVNKIRREKRIQVGHEGGEIIQVTEETFKKTLN